MKVIRTIEGFEDYRRSLALPHGLQPDGPSVAHTHGGASIQGSVAPNAQCLALAAPAPALALVPTMGAFHEGHLSLMRRAREIAQTVAVSLFVNPTQFRAGEDFQKYPRNEARDFALAEGVGVDVVFAPSQEEMYPSTETTVHVSGPSVLWEGALRPGHFDGVATVVAKLFNIIGPEAAVFGEKDYQQCRVIERMVENLNFPVRLFFEPTIREPDGLAMSSRNAYLDARQRTLAPSLYAEMRLAAEQINSSATKEARPYLDLAQARLEDAGFGVDYLVLVDPSSLAPIDTAAKGGRLIAAVRLGATRLIDNLGV